MAAAVPVRADHDAAQLRALARQSEDADQTRRLLALAVIYDGGARREAAQVGGGGRQRVRVWLLAFTAAGPSGLVDRKAPGKPPLLTDAQRQALARIVETGPVPAPPGGGPWRGCDLARRGFEA